MGNLTEQNPSSLTSFNWQSGYVFFCGALVIVLVIASVFKIHNLIRYEHALAITDAAKRYLTSSQQLDEPSETQKIRVKIFPHDQNYLPQGIDQVKNRLLFRSERPCKIYEALAERPAKKNRFISQTSKLDIHAVNLTVPIWLECEGPVKLVRSQPLNSYQYDGSFYIKRELSSQGDYSIKVINIVDIETYLRGVVPAEVFVSWPEEALKSQAVAARTYAMYHMYLARQNIANKDHDFDVDDTVQYQAYTGLSDINPRTDSAIAQTKGEIITYKNNIIPAYYHADSGGWIEAPETIWSKKLPFFRERKESFRYQKYGIKWRKSMSLVEVANKLGCAGLLDEKLQIENIRVVKQQKNTSRVKALEVILNNGQKLEIDRTLFRKIISLDSLNFEVQLVEQGQDKRVEFLGKGFGHGIGMSQVGALILARVHAWKYQQILAYYYEGTQLCSVKITQSNSLPLCYTVKARRI